MALGIPSTAGGASGPARTAGASQPFLFQDPDHVVARERAPSRTASGKPNQLAQSQASAQAAERNSSTPTKSFAQQPGNSRGAVRRIPEAYFQLGHATAAADTVAFRIVKPMWRVRCTCDRQLAGQFASCPIEALCASTYCLSRARNQQSRPQSANDSTKVLSRGCR